MKNIIKMIVEKVKSDPEFEFDMGTLAIAALFAGFAVFLGVTGMPA